MQVFTKLQFLPDDWSQPGLANAQPESTAGYRNGKRRSRTTGETPQPTLA